MEQAKKKGLPTWAVVLIVLGVGAVVGLPVLSALAIYGVRKYMRTAKVAEATASLQAWGTGMVGCGEKEGSLPPSSAAVPAALASVGAMKYQSAANDWADTGFSCAGFAMSGPQYFQYQWVQESASKGALRALGDLDGDGAPEEAYEVTVSCVGGRCSASAPTNVTTP